MSQHFEDLEKCYIDLRANNCKLEEGPEQMNEFTDCLSKFTRYSSFRPLASLSYAVDLFNGNSSIVSR